MVLCPDLNGPLEALRSGGDSMHDGLGARLSRAIDRLSGACGVLAGLACLLMIVIGAFNALARYADRFTGWGLSSNAYIEAQWYLFSIVFLLGGAVSLRDGRHVRVDVLSGRLGDRGRAGIELAGGILFLIPFSIFVILMSWTWVVSSWKIGEGSSDPGGLPRYPIKALILVAFALLAMQGVSEVIKAWRILRHGPASTVDVAGEEAGKSNGPTDVTGI